MSRLSLRRKATRVAQRYSGRAFILCASLAIAGCSSEEFETPSHGGGTAGTDASAGTAGTDASAGTAGTGATAGAGATGGAGGAGATGGAGGAGATGGAGGTGGGAGVGGGGGCPAGLADCNGNTADGCETDVGADPANCGSCNHVCSPKGVVAPSCNAGKCVASCSASYSDCNLDADDGCEVDLLTDVDHCGACSNVCSTNGAAVRTCVAGACAPTCAAGKGDCKKPAPQPDDGCETDLQADPDNCGVCGYLCSTNGVVTRTCSKGACTPSCVAGKGDCASPFPQPDDGCETDLLSSAQTCGACGHDCQGGACAGGKCQPLLLTKNTYYGAFRIAVDTARLYWTAENDPAPVRSVGLFGGLENELATGEKYPRSIVSDGTNVYWTSAAWLGGVKMVPVTGGTVTTIYTAAAGEWPSPIAVDGGWVYWGNQGLARDIMKRQISGGPVLSIGSLPNTYPDSLVVDGSYAYWTGLAVAKVSVSGGSAQEIFPPTDSARRLVRLGTTLYISTTKGIVSLPAAGGTPTLLTSETAEDLATDSSGLYYSTPWGSSTAIKRIPLSGGAATTIISAQNPRRIALDAKSIYWVAEGTGEILKLAK